MNREIKFRAWSEKDGIELIESLYWFEENYIKDVNDTHFKIMQFTGLKDKNGKDIYEGDIVEIDSFGIITNHAVKWFSENRYPAFDLKPYFSCDTNGLSHALNAPNTEIEVIGNLHENPELLEGLK